MAHISPARETILYQRTLCVPERCVKVGLGKRKPMLRLALSLSLSLSGNPLGAPGSR